MVDISKFFFCDLKVRWFAHSEVSYISCRSRNKHIEENQHPYLDECYRLVGDIFNELSLSNG